MKTTQREEKKHILSVSAMVFQDEGKISWLKKNAQFLWTTLNRCVRAHTTTMYVRKRDASGNE